MQKDDRFLTFFDGTVEIGGHLHAFGERTISLQRHYAARAAGQKIARLIHIPFTREIHVNEQAVIAGRHYIIDQVQPVQRSLPPCTVLTLSEYEVADE